MHRARPSLSSAAGDRRAVRRARVTWPLWTLISGLCLTACDLGGVPVEPVAACSQPIRDYFARDHLMMPDEEGAFEPADAAARATMRATLEAALEADLEALHPLLDASPYRVCRDSDADAFLLWPPPRSGLPLVAFRQGGVEEVILEVPHPSRDLYTRTQGIDAFLDRRVAALLVSGADRCAAAEVAACPSDTRQCDGAYRASDPAHHPESMFQSLHEVLSAWWPEALVVSLHGQRADTLIISDGTEQPTAAGSAIAEIAQALRGTLPRVVSVESCNAVPGLPATGRMCAVSNVQGRHLNHAPEMCIDPGEAGFEASGRFVHLEQPPAVRSHAAVRLAIVEAVIDRRPVALDRGALAHLDPDAHDDADEGDDD